MIPIPKTIDRGFVRMMAVKRTVTGALSIVGALVLLGVVITGERGRVGGSLGPIVLALALLGGGGAWSLRDGLRLWKLLRSN